MTASLPDPANERFLVEVSDTQSHLTIDRAMLSSIVIKTLLDRGILEATISLVIVDNGTIHALNRKHLAHDWPTDVITFPLSDASETRLHGELVLSAEMAATTAYEIGIDPQVELALYLVHGLLHLCGYDDHTEFDQVAMRQAESNALDIAGFANPFELIERATGETLPWVG